MVYAVVGAEAVVPDAQLVPHQVWVGTRRGVLVGVLTDPPKLRSGPWTREHDRLARVSFIQKCLIAEAMEGITGLPPRDVEVVLEEVAPERFDAGTVMVDGLPVAVETLTYRGLEFAFGADTIRFPFVVLRLAGSSQEWPALETQVQKTGRWND